MSDIPNPERQKEPWPEDWKAYSALKDRIRDIYPPEEAQEMIWKLLEIVQM